VPRIDLGRFGAVVSPGDEDFVEQAIELEGLGFSTIWLTGGPMSRLAQVSEVVQATSTARIATGIISVDRFPAADVGELYAELEGLAPGRFVVGLGGAHLREKVVAAAAREMVVVADETKIVGRLGERAPLPVEVITFALPVAERLLRGLGWDPELRVDDGRPFVTDEGNRILHCRREEWVDTEALAADISQVPGVVAHGFFLGFASAAVVATREGVQELRRPTSPP